MEKGEDSNLSFCSCSFLPLLVRSTQFIIFCATGCRIVNKIEKLCNPPDQIVEHRSGQEEGDVRVDMELGQQLVDGRQLLCVVVLRKEFINCVGWPSTGTRAMLTTLLPIPVIGCSQERFRTGPKCHGTGRRACQPTSSGRPRSPGRPHNCPAEP